MSFQKVAPKKDTVYFDTLNNPFKGDYNYFAIDSSNPNFVYISKCFKFDDKTVDDLRTLLDRNITLLSLEELVSKFKVEESPNIKGTNIVLFE